MPWRRIMKGKELNPGTKTEKERFLLITRDLGLARTFASNQFKYKELKKIIRGGGMVVAVGWGAKVDSASVLLAISDPEPITRMIVSLISILSPPFGGYWVLRFSRYRMQGK